MYPPKSGWGISRSPAEGTCRSGRGHGRALAVAWPAWPARLRRALNTSPSAGSPRPDALARDRRSLSRAAPRRNGTAPAVTRKMPEARSDATRPERLLGAPPSLLRHCALRKLWRPCTFASSAPCEPSSAAACSVFASRLATSVATSSERPSAPAALSQAALPPKLSLEDDRRRRERRATIAGRRCSSAPSPSTSSGDHPISSQSLRVHLAYLGS